MKSKHMTIGMQNKLQNKNRKKGGCSIDRRTIKRRGTVFYFYYLFKKCRKIYLLESERC